MFRILKLHLEKIWLIIYESKYLHVFVRIFNKRRQSSVLESIRNPHQFLTRRQDKELDPQPM